MVRVIRHRLGVHTPAVVDSALTPDIRRILVKLDRLQLNFCFQQLLDVGHQTRIAPGDKTQSQAQSAGTPGAANAVDVVFRIERNIKIEDGRHILDVQTACRHVGADQQIHLSAFERLQCLEALILALVAMQGGGVQAFALERAGQPRAAQFAVDENKGLLDSARLQNLMQGMALVVIANTVKMLFNGGSRAIGAAHLDRRRVLQIAAGQALDLG